MRNWLYSTPIQITPIILSPCSKPRRNFFILFLKCHIKKSIRNPVRSTRFMLANSQDHRTIEAFCIELNILRSTDTYDSRSLVFKLVSSAFDRQYRNRRYKQLWGVVRFERVDRYGENRKNERNRRVGEKTFLERNWLDTFCERLFKEDILLGNFARQLHSISFYVQEGPWWMVT